MGIIKEIVKPDIHLTIWRKPDGTARCIAASVVFKTEKRYEHVRSWKKNRVSKLNTALFKCEKCGKSTKIVHHISTKPTNHSIDNLMVLCQSCHIKLHKRIVG